MEICVSSHMQRSNIISFILSVLFLTISCQCKLNGRDVVYGDLVEVSSDSAKIDISIYCKSGVYVIHDTLDLQWKTLYLPADISLDVDKGLVKNGCIVGSNTRLKYRNSIFDSVRVKGTWLIPYISTSMFKTLSYDNSLKDVLALANPQMQNRIHIEKGTYQITATETSSRCLIVGSNTNMTIDGTIALTSNNLTGYSILNISGKNIIVSGKGCVIGDKFTHIGTDGEWGMGIYISGGENISVKGLNIRNCWGDCIYIRKNAKDVVIENCTLDNGRRQGISIISAQNVYVRNCKIVNIGGTNPGYAIDVEPNQEDTVKNVRIEKVEVNNCWGGIECNGNAKESMIYRLDIKKCSVSKIKRWPLRFIRAKSISVEDNRIDYYRKPEVIFFSNIDDAYVGNITINGRGIKRKENIMSVITSEKVKQLRIN